MDERRLAVREAAEPGAPEVNLAVGRGGGADLGIPGLPARRVAEEPHPAPPGEPARQKLRVAGADEELVGVDDGQGVEGDLYKREPHRVQGEVVQPPPLERPRARMEHRAVAMEGEGREQAASLAAVVEQDRRLRVETAQVAHQVDDALRALVHQAGEEVAERGHSKLR